MEWFIQAYTESRVQLIERFKVTVSYGWVLVVTKWFNIVVNDFDAKKAPCYSQVFVVAELVVRRAKLGCVDKNSK